MNLLATRKIDSGFRRCWPVWALLGVLLAGSAHAGADWARSALERGATAFRAGRFREAVVELSVAAQRPKPDPATYLYLGYSYYKLGEHAAGADAIRLALRLDRRLDGPIPRFFLGLTLFRRQLYLGARGHLRKVVRFAGPASRLGLRAKRFLREIERALRSAKPDTALAYHQRGVSQLAAGSHLTAAGSFTEALRWMDRSPRKTRRLRAEAWIYLTGALCLARRCADALRRLRRLPDAGRSPSLQLARAVALAGTGKVKQARRLVRRIARRASPRLRPVVESLLQALPVGGGR